MAYLVIIITLTESFPMDVQSVCSGIVESLAQLGIFVGPIVVTFCINLQVYPMIVFSGFLILFIVLPVLGLEETLTTRSQKSEPLLQDPHDPHNPHDPHDPHDALEAKQADNGLK